jgi:hypothetical protein
MSGSRKKYCFVVFGLALLTMTGRVGIAHAQVTFEALPDNKVYNDFVVGPGKIEVELDPGGSRTIDVTVANRLGTDKTFTLGIEDFTGSDDPGKTVVLLGDDRGPYSLKDYIHPATGTIDIPQGMKARIPVVISIPSNAQPGGLYGSVIVGTLTKSPTSTPAGGAVPSSPVITRIGTLFFVRVKGPVVEDGRLTEFSLSGRRRILWDSSPVTFNLLYKNDGNVHLDPFGTLSVTNMLGASVGAVDVEAWFAMPRSLRFRQVSWTPPFLFGRYVAHASINRGYGSTTDEMDTVFWVIPWKIILGALIALIVIIAGVRFVFSRFTIVSKPR